MDLKRLVSDENRFDKRLTQRLVRAGELSREDLARHLESLPDQTGKFDEIPLDETLLFGRSRRASLRAAVRSEDETID